MIYELGIYESIVFGFGFWSGRLDNFFIGILGHPLMSVSQTHNFLMWCKITVFILRRLGRKTEEKEELAGPTWSKLKFRQTQKRTSLYKPCKNYLTQIVIGRKTILPTEFTMGYFIMIFVNFYLVGARLGRKRGTDRACLIWSKSNLAHNQFGTSLHKIDQDSTQKLTGKINQLNP